jgi:hypothetical protein
VRRFEFTIAPVDDEPFTFFTGQLETAEIGSMFLAVIKRMASEPVGWTLHVRELGRELGPDGPS